MPRQTVFLALALLFVISGSITAHAQNFNLTTAVLVNSSNAAGFNTDPAGPGGYQRHVERYLENFQIPYEIFDVSTAAPPADLNRRQLIVAGHSGLSLSDTWQTAITTAVNGGTGFVNFDSDPAIGTAAHIQAIFQATGSTLGTPGSSIIVPFAVSAAGATPHFIAGLQVKTLEPAGDFVYGFHPDQDGNANTVTATLLQDAQGTVIATIGSDPLIVATTYGTGRAVNFGTLDYLQADRFGFLMGVDDLFWRSLVWAARKPFIIRGYPRFWSVRMDHNLDSDWYSRIREMYDPTLTGQIASDGTGGPWKVTGSVNLNFMPPGDSGRANVISDIKAGKLQISPHAFTSSSLGDLFWDGFDTPTRDLTDSEWQDNVSSIQDFQQGNGGDDQIPFFSQWWLGHFYTLSNNIGFDLANTFGVRYIGTTIKPGFPYTTDPTESSYQTERLQAYPYRLYQLPPKPAAVFASDESYSFFFADDITIDSRAGFAPQKFFLVGSRTLDPAVSEIPDLSWCNAQGDGADFAVARFEWYSWRLFSSMVPVEAYNQDDSFQQCALAPPPPASSYHNASEQIIHDVSAWLNANQARHVFMQDMAQYMYAHSKSKLTGATFDGSKISYTFSGSAADPDGNLVPTQLLVFGDDSEGHWEAIPGFTNGLVASMPEPPGSPVVVAVKLVAVSNLPNLVFTSTGSTQQLQFLATLSDGTILDLSSLAGTSFLSSNPGAATVNSSGLVTAVANGTALITATNGGNSATATISVNIPPPDFSIPGTLGSVSIAAGQAATFNLPIAPLNGFNQALTFSCSGAPAGATCTVSPNPVIPSGSGTAVQVKLTTTARASASPVSETSPGAPFWLGLLTASVTFVLLQRLIQGRRLRLAVPAFALLLISIGCGGGGSNTAAPPTNGMTGTPAGSFVLTITASGGGANHVTSATVVVK